MNFDLSLSLSDFKNNDKLYKSFKDAPNEIPSIKKSENYTEEWFIEPQEDYLSKAFQILGLDIEKANKPKNKEGEPITITNRKTGKQMKGHWRTMNGNKVFVSSNGKIQVGPEHIKEKFSDGDKATQESKKDSGLKDKVDHFKSLDNKGKKEYLDTLKNKWIPETEKQLKGAKSDTAKKLYEQQLKFEKKKLLPAIEKEYKDSESNDLDKQLDQFREIAKKSKDVEDFMNRARKIQVPAEVSEYFRKKYSNSPFESSEKIAERFLNKYK